MRCAMAEEMNDNELNWRERKMSATSNVETYLGSAAAGMPHCKPKARIDFDYPTFPEGS